MKYIIDTDALYGGDIYKIMLLMGTNSRGEVIVQKFNLDELEELNSGYINRHFSDLQDTAYQRGFEDGRNVGIKDGMCEAWEAARKIVTWPDRSLVNSNTFDLDHGENIFTKYSASEAIAKLKAYEEKQKEEDSIKVGDEVINNITGTKGILLEPETEDLLATVIVPNHRWNTFNISHINLTKTGRHFDIEGILEAMENG